MSDERGYARVSLADVEPRDLDDLEPTLLSVGYELRPSEMRPNVWRFEPGESTSHHRHEAQEELYVVLEGRFDVRVNDDEFAVEEGDYLVVDPGTWRQLTAPEGGLLLVVGAPSVKEDDVRKDG